MNTKGLRWIVMGGLFLLPLSVLFVANSLFFPFITGKVFFYRIVVEIVFAAWLVLAVLKPDYRPYKQKIYYLLSGLLGVLLVSNILSASPYKAFWSNFERMDGWVSLIHHVMFFVVISSMFTAYKTWEKFWKVSLGVSIIVCFYGLLQRFGVLEAIQGSGARVDGTFGNAAYLAVYNLFHFFLASWLLYKSRIRGAKVFYGLIGLFNLFNLYWTATRGVFVGLVVGLFVTLVIILIKAKEHKKIRTIAGGVLLVGFIAVGSVFALKDTQFVSGNPTLSRFSTISLTEGETRFTVWKMAMRGIVEKPVLGWGQEGFSAVFAKYYESSMYNQEPWFDRAHNVVIDWLVAGGVVGFILYASLLIFGVRYIWKSDWLDTIEKALFTGLYVGYFVQNLFVFDNVGSYMMFFAVLAFSASATKKDQETTWCEDKKIPEHFLKPFTGIVIIGLIFAVYTVNVKPIKAGQDLIRAITSGQDNSRVVGYYESALSRNTFATPEIVEQIMVQAPGFVFDQNISAEDRQAYLSMAVEAVEKELERQSENVRLLYASGIFFNRVGQTDRGIMLLERAQELSPKKQIILFELAFSYITQGDSGKGMSILKKTYEVEPEFEEAQKMYFLGAVYTNDTNLEESLLKGLSEDFIYTDNRVIQAYVNTERYTDLLNVWKMKVEFEPANIQNHVSLAATYLQIGNRNKAIEIIEGAIKINPQFKEQGQKIIEDIRKGTL